MLAEAGPASSSPDQPPTVRVRLGGLGPPRRPRGARPGPDERSRPTRRRIFLTGHSMGGHGTWHLGVTFPDRFAAIAPSAGWVSMMSYAGADRPRRPRTPSQLVAARAMSSDTLGAGPQPRTLAASMSFTATPTTTCQSGRRGRCGEVLGTFHPDFVYHEQPGAGHWWG